MARPARGEAWWPRLLVASACRTARADWLAAVPRMLRRRTRPRRPPPTQRLPWLLRFFGYTVGELTPNRVMPR
jgi:hypothetical protein